MIEVIELGKSYSRRKILEKVFFSLTDSCIFTLWLAEMELVKNDAADIYGRGIFQGFHIVKLMEFLITKCRQEEHLFYVPDDKGMLLNLTGEEYPKFIVKLYHRTEDNILPQIERNYRKLFIWRIAYMTILQLFPWNEAEKLYDGGHSYQVRRI